VLLRVERMKRDGYQSPPAFVSTSHTTLSSVWRFYTSNRWTPKVDCSASLASEAGSAVKYTVILLLTVLHACACAAAPASDRIALKIAAINDFHGWLQPSPERVRVMGPQAPLENAVTAGGMTQLAAMIDRLRQQNRNFAFVSAGDLFGASPLLSAMFDDEPTIEAMNAAGLDFNGVGNHEFDRGVADLRRMQAGGCPPNGCKSGASFSGARFPFSRPTLSSLRPAGLCFHRTA